MSIFKAYDIRGVYGKDLTEKDAYLIGYYLPKFLKLKEIKIAHDLRLSYESLTKFLIAGLIDSNCNVIYLGESSTPNFYFSLFKGVQSGIMITASHNPKEYNGFKIMNNLNSFDSRNGLYDLEKLIKKNGKKILTFQNVTSQNSKFSDGLGISNSLTKRFKTLEKISLNKFLKSNNIVIKSTLKEYNNFIFDLYNKILNDDEKNILKKIKFNVDFSSGVSSLSGNHFLKKIKLNYNLLNEKPNGNFPVHSPDPVKAKKFLKKKNLKVDFSAVFDGDGDRIFFYDENNVLIFTDYIIALLVDYFSNQFKNFVCDLRVSKDLEKLAKQKNLNLSLIRVGRAFYKNFMDKNNCIFGAELSGHLFFNDFKNLDNPDIALIYILKIIAQNLLKNKNKKFKFTNLIDKYKVYFKIEETNIEVKNPNKVLMKLKKEFKKNIIMEIDGLSFDFKDYWFNVRKSNTENLLRINFEGKNEKITKLEFNKLISFINLL